MMLMNTIASHQPFTRWSQLLGMFLLPGIFQGLAFYGVVDGMEDTLLDWRAFVLWFLAIAPTCVFLISVPGDRWRSLIVSLIVGLVLAALFYSDARDATGIGAEQRVPGSVLLVAVTSSLVVIFVVLPFYRTRWQRGLGFSHYPSLFEFAWNHTVCVSTGVAFTGLVAALMGLSVALFDAVGVSLEHLVFDTPFLGAWLGAAFATAIGVTRQSDAIVLGTRELLLTLLRVLLPVMLPISAVFLVAVLVLGVDNLETGLSIALIVIVAAIIGIVLCSARVGDAEDDLTMGQQVLTRGMAAVCLPLSLLATHALWFRVAQHGWTGHRVLIAIVIALSVLYGLGYLLAAVHHPRRIIPIVNRSMAVVCMGVALLSMTPWLDPDRIAVRDQMARFDDGRVSAEALDLAYLKFDSGRVGRDALATLSTRAEARVAPLQERLAELAKVHSAYDLASIELDPELRSNIIDAIQKGSLRVLQEEESGWARVSDPSEVPDMGVDPFSAWNLFEVRIYCIEQQQDCAYLMGRAGAAIMTIRTADTSLLLYRVPEGGAIDPMPESYPTPMGGLGVQDGLTAEEIVKWFDSLDRGELATVSVALPAIAIGRHRVLLKRSVYLPE